MRVALLGDIHGNTRYLDWALEQAVDAGAESVIQLGDFGFDYNDDFLFKLGDIMDKHQIPMFVVRGNHDNPWWFRRYRRFGWVNFIPDGTLITLGSKRVAFLGGAVSIDRDFREENVSWWKDERVNPHVVNAWMIDDVKADVLISHEAPLKPDNLSNFLKLSPDVIRDCDEDRNFVRTAAEILEPEAIYHGHYHIRHTKTLFMQDNKKALIEGLSCDGNPIKDTMLITEW